MQGRLSKYKSWTALLILTLTTIHSQKMLNLSLNVLEEFIQKRGFINVVIIVEDYMGKGRVQKLN